MTVVKRTQGRPPRNSGMNGRDKLIEATRMYLRSNRKMSLTRTEIAQGCGVTPALISYYFKDKKSLLDAVMKPLIRAYQQELNTVLSAEASPAEKMKGLIRLLIGMNFENAFLMDYMFRDVASQQMDADDRAVIDIFHRAISALAGDLVTRELWRAADLLMIEVALWGMCRAFGEALRAEESPSGSDHRRAALDAKVDFVYAAFSPGRQPVAIG
jgi:AcrR family transcriptional regulator